MASGNQTGVEVYLGVAGTRPATPTCMAPLPASNDLSDIASRPTPKPIDLINLVHSVARTSVASKLGANDVQYQDAFGLLDQLQGLYVSRPYAPKIAPNYVPKNLSIEVSKYIDDAKKFDNATDVNKRKMFLKDMRDGEAATLAIVLGMIAQLDLGELGQLISPRLAFATSLELISVAGAVAKSAEGAVGRVGLEPSQIRMLNHLVEEFEVGAQAARNFLSLYFTHHSEIESCSIDRIDGGTGTISPRKIPTFRTPVEFRDALIDKDNPNAANEKFQLGGTGYAYSTQPVERTQRISTIASAAEAYEFGLALAGQAPQAGIGGEGGLGATRQATGKVQARENTPLVVGFSRAGDRSQIFDPNNNNVSNRVIDPSSQFGWVFGPRVQLDPENKQLKLIQHLKPYDVSADLSLPGWWPHVNLKLQTVWIGNWKNQKLVDLGSNPDKGEILTQVRLHSNRADMDGLTNDLARDLLGRSLHATRITHVVPKSISTCANPNDILIYGSNIWRSTEVFLDGVAADLETIRVLPDMEGISVRFPREALGGRSHKLGSEVSLVVWTRNGSDEYKIDVTGTTGDATCTDTRAPGTPKIRIAAAHPSQISVCGNQSEFLVSVAGITELFKVTLGGKGVTGDVVPHSSDEKVTVIGFTAQHGKEAWSGLPSVKLVVAGKEGVASTDVTLVGDRRNCAARLTSKPPPKPAIKVVNTTYGGNVMDACLPSGTVTVRGTSLASIATAEWLGKRVTATPLTAGKVYTASFTGLPVLPKELTGDASRSYIRFYDAKGKEVEKKELWRTICSTAKS